MQYEANNMKVRFTFIFINLFIHLIVDILCIHTINIM